MVGNVCCCLEYCQVHTEEEMSKLLQQAEGAKRRAATFMNARSSRAHSLLFLNLVQTTTRSSADEETESVVKRSQLCLADLGGSEQVKKSGVEGERLQEAVNINLGLLSLKNVISHLHRKAHYIPFSDNRLTELLRGVTRMPYCVRLLDV
jgi:kinesin family protein 5